MSADIGAKGELGMEKVPENMSVREALVLMIDTFGGNDPKSYLPYEKQVLAAVKKVLDEDAAKKGNE